MISHKLGTNVDFDDPSMVVERKMFKRLSPRFEGVYNLMNVWMANIHVNFMPGTFNNLFKMMRATKRQIKPVDDDNMAG